MDRFYAILSGEHPTIPHSELEAILEVEAAGHRILLRLDGAAVFEANLSRPEIITMRAGWVREVGRLLALVEAEAEIIEEAARSAVERLGPPRSVEYKRFRRYGEHLHGTGLRERLRRLASPRGGYTLRVFVSEGAALVGVVVSRLDTRSLNTRRPGRRPFFRPGPLQPEITRAMINLSRLRRGSPFLDPFCGTGGFVLEACLIGARMCVCTDINSIMVRGSTVNLEHYGVSDRCLVAQASATALPVPSRAVPSIATDPPYGRSTSTGRAGYKRLVERFLEEADRVLESGGYLVFAGPAGEEPHMLARSAGFMVLERHQMYVHSSLVREIVVARKG